MSNICVRKPNRITLHYDDGVDIVLEPPVFFDKLFFQVDDDHLKELEELGVLEGK